MQYSDLASSTRHSPRSSTQYRNSDDQRQNTSSPSLTQYRNSDIQRQNRVPIVTSTQLHKFGRPAPKHVTPDHSSIFRRPAPTQSFPISTRNSDAQQITSFPITPQ
ncbi:hypothetical protein AVEN_125039-1 [Araneus ventricosus]|uniref:Uncharacterized protein n=1 Tax=Araneus ventricosus TaxID=182803 RepID=A0A4Y2H1F3_ARAVE|nr:hypothetical protein AVEN_125039-1 [Araneus ventricosus]